MRCPICASNNTKYNLSHRSITLFICKKCKTKFQYPLSDTESLKIYTTDSYSMSKEAMKEQKLLFQNRLSKLETLIGSKQKKVLDIGCGAGLFLEVALERGWQCVGQELSKGSYLLIKERLGLDIIVCNSVLEANLCPESFDLIHMSHVLEHVNAPVKTVKEVFRLLKPGGLFYCEVPRQSNFLHYLSKLIAHKNFRSNYHEEHLFTFNKLSLHTLFAQEGFEIVSMKIEDVSTPHRYVYNVHYTAKLIYIISWLVGMFKLQTLLGVGNLVVISKKPTSN